MRRPYSIHFIFSRLRAVWRLALVFLWTFVLFPIAVILRLCGAAAWMHRLARLWHAGLLRIINISVSVSGVSPEKADKAQGVLWVGNHISYLDIVIMGSLFPCRFIAKSEVEGWPFLGLLSKLQWTIFVKRENRQSLPQTQKRIAESIFQGYPYILFAEGTSGDGTYILPYRSSLLQLVVGESKDIAVQAFCLQYTAYGGLPVGRFHRPYFGWYGDMELAPHVWDLLSLSGGSVEVRFTEAVKGSDFENRKLITQALQTRTEEALQDIRFSGPRSRQDSNLRPID